MSSQHHLVASPALSSSRQPRLSLLMRALHPICRHYTLSVRVHRHITGAAPHNGCVASGSSPAHQSTRNSNEGQLRLRKVDHVHQSTRNGDEAALPSVRHSHLCTRRPHFHLFRGAVHPNRRHYTPSVRVQRHITGAAPVTHPLHTSPHATVTRGSCAFARSIMSTNPHTTVTRQSSPLCDTLTSTHTDHTFTCSEGQCTRTVGITPLLFGCIAT